MPSQRRWRRLASSSSAASAKDSASVFAPAAGVDDHRPRPARRARRERWTSAPAGPAATARMAGEAGVEPATSALTMRRSPAELLAITGAPATSAIFLLHRRTTGGSFPKNKRPHRAGRQRQARWGPDRDLVRGD